MEKCHFCNTAYTFSVEELKRILKQKPEAVYVEGNVFETYPIVHQLRKKHIPVLTMMEKDGQKLIIKIPSGS